MPKPAGVERVFILGESAAALLGGGDQVLHGSERGGRPRRIPGAGILSGDANSGLEIINCGMAGYESSRIYGILTEVLAYSPDLLVVLSGNREGSPVFQCPGPAFELRRREFRLLEKYYSFKYDPRQAREKASLKMHEAMLAKMAGAAKKAGVPIVFCTLPVNVKDLPSTMAAPLENELFAAGYKLFYENKYQAAAEKFRLALAARPSDHFSNFYMAKTLERTGRSGEAKTYFFKALEFDGDMDRASPERNALIKRAAGSGGACVADLEKFIYERSPGGLAGFPEFTDGMHWRPAYNKMIWEEIFRSAGACGIKGFGKFKAADSESWKETPRMDARRRLSYALFWMQGSSLSEGALAELSYIREKSPALLGEAAVSSEKLDKLLIRNFWSMGQITGAEGVFPFFLAHLSEAERRSGNYGAAMTLCERARALKPGDENIRLVRAQILAGLGRRKEAEKEFLESRLQDKARALGLAYGFSVHPPAPGR